jgi:hypothetical protein
MFIVLLSLLVAGFAILLASPIGFHWFAPECRWSPNMLIGAVVLLASCLLLLALLLRRKFRQHRERVSAIEGELPDRLGDGSIQLLRVSWLLERPANYIMERCQDLPPEAFWSAADALRLLREGKVAALSYRWLERLHPDPAGFHLKLVLAHFGTPKHARS